MEDRMEMLEKTIVGNVDFVNGMQICGITRDGKIQDSVQLECEPGSYICAGWSRAIGYSLALNSWQEDYKVIGVIANQISEIPHSHFKFLQELAPDTAFVGIFPGQPDQKVIEKMMQKYSRHQSMPPVRKGILFRLDRGYTKYSIFVSRKTENEDNRIVGVEIRGDNKIKYQYVVSQPSHPAP